MHLIGLLEQAHIELGVIDANGALAQDGFDFLPNYRPGVCCGDHFVRNLIHCTGVGRDRSARVNQLIVECVTLPVNNPHFDNDIILTGSCRFRI